MTQPTTRLEMISLIESDIKALELIRDGSFTISKDPILAQRIRIYTAISLLLRMECNPNAQD